MERRVAGVLLAVLYGRPKPPEMIEEAGDGSCLTTKDFFPPDRPEQIPGWFESPASPRRVSVTVATRRNEL